MRIAVATVKGGVGKTTTTVNLGAALAELGFRVLLVDMDQQANLTSLFHAENGDPPCTVANILVDSDIPTARAIFPTHVPGVDVLASGLELSRLDIQLAGDPDAQYYLAEKLGEVAEQYDHILIDCPPSLGLQTLSALVAAEFVIIPVECQEWAARGSVYLLEVMSKVKRRANPGLRLLGYLINRYDSRRKVEESYKDILVDRFRGEVFETIIRNSVRFPEAVTMRLPITMYRPTSEQADHFRCLAQEVLTGGPTSEQNAENR